VFILKLQDRNGVELREGDIVRISDGKNFNFFSEVKYLPEYKVIAPFHTFSFHSVEKVDSLPDGAMEGKAEERYKLWYVPEPDEDGVTEDKFLKYLNSWRECEYQLNGRAYCIQHVSLVAA
jgi:hypothetical protein